MWRYLACGVAGPDHQQSGGDLQDRNRVQVVQNDSQVALVACVADGAGSAEFGGEGAEIACHVVASNAVDHFRAARSHEPPDRTEIIRWCDFARFEIERNAEARESASRQFATTLCFALVASDWATFFQIGDGAIIVRRNGALGTVFWPQSGEFANSTNFITSDDYQDHLEFCVTSIRVDEVALLTDGMERMSLCFDSRTPYVPFFGPIFDAMHGPSDDARLSAELQAFLVSEPVQNRSHDDKTIIIASRMP